MDHKAELGRLSLVVVSVSKNLVINISSFPRVPWEVFIFVSLLHLENVRRLQITLQRKEPLHKPPLTFAIPNIL